MSPVAWPHPQPEPSDSYSYDVVDTVVVEAPLRIDDLVSCTTEYNYLLIASRSALSVLADELLQRAAEMQASGTAPPLVRGFRTQEYLAWAATRFNAMELRELLAALGTTRPLAIGTCNPDGSNSAIAYIRDLILFMIQDGSGHVLNPNTGQFLTTIHFALWHARHAHGGRLLREPSGEVILKWADWIR